MLGLPDGFEGNAQSFRILTALDSCGATPRGMNLTRAVRAAVLKYPWTRNEWRSKGPISPELLPRGIGTDPSAGAMKYSTYDISRRDGRCTFGIYGIAQYQQTLECSVMDIADDIAYAVHDLDDFYRAGILQYRRLGRITCDSDHSAQQNTEDGRVGSAPVKGMHWN